MPKAARKLNKEDRRAQLLNVAIDLVRADGTGNLTLARLAENAGVTKPITYEHFTTREGLLLAMFEVIDKKTEATVMAALATGPKSRDETLEVIANAYVDCFVSQGQTFGAILNALSAQSETNMFKLKWRAELAKAVLNILTPHGGLATEERRVKLIGVFGAAEALCETAAAGEISAAQVKLALKSLFISAVQPQQDEALASGPLD